LTKTEALFLLTNTMFSKHVASPQKYFTPRIISFILVKCFSDCVIQLQRSL